VLPVSAAPPPRPAPPPPPPPAPMAAPSEPASEPAAPPPGPPVTEPEPVTLVAPALQIPEHARATVAGTPARVINPFLVQDPQVKARRLARALISDMVSYHPAKRAQGLRDGTLKDIFREEIKKSYEEYVLQVGEETARSTTHFQEALNEILAGGQRIF